MRPFAPCFSSDEMPPKKTTMPKRPRDTDTEDVAVKTEDSTAQVKREPESDVDASDMKEIAEAAVEEQAQMQCWRRSDELFIPESPACIAERSGRRRSAQWRCARKPPPRLSQQRGEAGASRTGSSRRSRSDGGRRRGRSSSRGSRPCLPYSRVAGATGGFFEPPR